MARLLLLLSGAAGALDLLCVASLGGPFASVITGNVVQVGRGVSAPDAPLAVAAAVAVLGYVVGVAAATWVLHGRPVGWYGWTTALAAVEIPLAAGVLAGWLATDGDPDNVVSAAMLAMAGLAMGIQSALSVSTGLRGASTSYFTGTLTRVVQRAVVTTGHRLDAAGLLRLAALLLGAAAGGVVLRFAPLWTPVVPLALIVAAVLWALACSRPRAAA